jgi:hypothetical protein
MRRLFVRSIALPYLVACGVGPLAAQAVDLSTPSFDYSDVDLQAMQQAYGEKHEKELWRVFRERLEEQTDDHPGWFSGRNEAFPEVPWQIGYWLGMRMCEAYYEAAADRNEALRTLLTTADVEVYRTIAAAYDARLSTE